MIIKEFLRQTTRNTG